MSLSAKQMITLPDFFSDIPDPRRAQGRRHPLSAILAIASGAILCGMVGYKAIAGWAEDLGQKARARFGCRYVNGSYIVPSESIFRDILVRVDPDALDASLQKWHAVYGNQDQALAVDGKTMCNAIDDEGNQTHIMSVIGHETAACYTQKKVGTLPVEGTDEAKKTNEIGMFTSLLDRIEIAGKDITADALLTQRKLASYLVERGADYHFTAKGNQPTLRDDILEAFKTRQSPDYVEITPPDHGRIETRSIWTSTILNTYLDFPSVGQVYLIQREVLNKKTGEISLELVPCLTSRTPEEADAKCLLEINRGHWSIENSCHYVLDWNYNEDRESIRTGLGTRKYYSFATRRDWRNRPCLR